MQNDGSVSVARQFLHKRWVKVFLAIDVIAIFVVIGIVIWNATKTATINFNIAPVDAKIQLNGSGEYQNGTYQIHPGTYNVAISHDGLEPKNFTLDLSSGYVTTLTTFLKGEGDNFDFYELKENWSSLQKLEQIASKNDNLTTDQDTSAEDFIQTFQKNYNLYQTELPILWSTWKMTEMGSETEKYISIEANDSPDCQKLLCFKATMAMTVDKEIVETLLVSKGFNTDYCEVKYEVH